MLESVIVERPLLYRAGPQAYELIRTQGFDPQLIRAYVGPASGPKWLVLAGIDRAVISADLLRARRTAADERTLLVGASAGGWRALALACRDASAAHDELERAYTEMVFGRSATAGEISEAYRRMLANILTTDRTEQIMHHPAFDVALHVVRARGPAGSNRRRLQMAAMATAAALNSLSASTMKWSFKRLLFHTRPVGWRPGFDGDVVALDRTNIIQVALATGTIPTYMEPVRDIRGVAHGRYLDGGLTDYHLNQAYVVGHGGITMFPHFQERIVPNWFDGYVSRRTPPRNAVENLLQIYPSAEYVAGLPGGRVPNRDDFFAFMDDPDGRISRWRRVSQGSNRLGEQLIEDIEHGLIPELVQPILAV